MKFYHFVKYSPMKNRIVLLMFPILELAIPARSGDGYMAANPLAVGTELQPINTQYWVASFFNGPEAFANFRRRGFPALTADLMVNPPIRMYPMEHLYEG